MDRLRDRFTVVTYDPIGLSHGTLDGRPVADHKVQVWSENAHRLLDSLLPAGESAYVPDTGTSPMALFVTRVLCQFISCEPDLAALKPSADRLALAYGRDSRDLLLHRTGATPAGQLGSALTEFPGGHLGAIVHPAEFAERLAETLLPVGTPRVPLTT